MAFADWIRTLTITPETIFHILIMALFAIFWIGVFILLYHLLRFGIGLQPKKIALVFFLGSVVVFTITHTLYEAVDFDSLLETLRNL